MFISNFTCNVFIQFCIEVYFVFQFFIDIKAPAVVIYLMAYGIPYLFVFINFSVTVWYLDLPYDPSGTF